ncbi:preprotein translocase subunit SecA [Mycoplasma todarodis]|uniref:Protein translocase subunit SecA n=1 Tax=Mycoplasma todarodis TaxID=1937191 RepID=A0A4R0XL13_9MOLU|nr:preprotein translocase subunit SecA [Mycoplasma todarodis]TCG11154.1 preprotein translocase subunit SecA [Mycoplasma todarodis]
MKKIFKIKSSELKRAESYLKDINALEPEIKKLTDEELREKTEEFKERLNKDDRMEKITVEAFAVAREACFRVLGKRPYDVQIIGGLILTMGSVAEMKTGEGKTITSIMPVYMNALAGKGVIVSTVNEYLTERDAIETGQVHNFLGLTYGINKRELSTEEKREAYNCDITYSIHSEIGFDYLRDNMVKRMSEKVQRGFYFALIDEVDSILIDEARTPLIITGGDAVPSTLYEAAQAFVVSLKKKDYEIDAETKSIQLTGTGIDKANKFYGIENLFSLESSELVHRVQNALRANYVMEINGDYIVRDNKIELIDAFTGRIMEGRSYSDGLQQAIQAKEKVEIEDETKTMATVTYQNLFRMFDKLSGMTGTGKTEEGEFIDIYNMRVVEVPTNKPVIRKDERDNVYVTSEHKYNAIVNEIKRVKETTNQPILVGTSLVEQSEKLADLLKKNKIAHKVLNAKQDGKEAEIISKAGEIGAVTIATNMAGRGTDIKLDDASKEAGGLFVLGTDRAESRRIDNQLRGRAGRQGDVGRSKFFLSLDDSLISRFSAQEKLKKSFASFKDKPISSKSMDKALTRAQKKIEGFNYDSRKNVLQFDDVIRQQRNAIYNQRDIIISQEDLLNVIHRMFKKVVQEVVLFPQFQNQDDTINHEELANSLNNVWFENVEFKLIPAIITNLSVEELVEYISKELVKAYDEIRENAFEVIGEESTHDYERDLILETFDANWQLHIDHMDKLRSSSSMSSYAQKNPFQVFTEKGSELFDELIKRISHNTTRALMHRRF